MVRNLVLVLVVLTVHSATLSAQSRDTVPVGHRGTSLLFEAAGGVRLDPRTGWAHATRWYVSWELGPSFNRGSWAWGATMFASFDGEGARWGVRPRYRRWLGSKTALDFGAGVLLGGDQRYTMDSFPGIAGLVGFSYGKWLGVNLEFEAVPTTRISRDYSTPSYTTVETKSIDWASYIGARFSGLGTIPLLAAEAIGLVAVMIALSSCW